MNYVPFIAFALVLQTTAAQSSQPPVRVSSGVVAARLIHQVIPQYPEEAKRARVGGTVVMHVLLGEDGHVQEVSVVSGPEMLRKSYVDAVRQWVYKPYLLNGKPVPVETTIMLTLDLGA